MDAIKIEKDIPIPDKYRGLGTPLSVISIAAMACEIGDSFLADKPHRQIYGFLQTARKLGRKFTTRSVKGGTRVWRIK